jgi:chemotaxis signal transduction protein
MATDAETEGGSDPSDDDEETVPDRVEFVVFRVGDGRYAVELGHVGQVVRRPNVTRVPRTPAVVMGATSVGGDVTAVLDGHRLLGAGGDGAAAGEGDDGDAGPGSIPSLVLFDRDRTEQGVGIYAADVAGIEVVDVVDVRPVGEGDWSPATPDLFRAVLTLEDGPVGVLDPDRVAAAAAVR